MLSKIESQVILDVAEECYYEWLGKNKKEQREICAMNGTTRNTFYMKFIRPLIDKANGTCYSVEQLVLSF